MCTTCGCATGEVKIDGAEVQHDDAHGHRHVHTHADGTTHAHGYKTGHTHEHAHSHDHAPRYAPSHSHAPGMDGRRMVQIEQDILAKNNAYAARNRKCLLNLGIFALNLVSSPGSGKTTLLCKTISMLGDVPVAVIEGDQQTSQDAERIRATGAPAIQINTGKGCHLDAYMVGHAMDKLDLVKDSLLLIENVGNLVCPAAFDLGEAHKVAILSVTEGADKPIKYPDMFRAASLMLLNKIDLLPYVDFDMDAAIAYSRRVNPGIRVICVSATSSEGMDEWLAYLRDGMAVAGTAKRQSPDPCNQQIAEHGVPS
ncbi:MAG: hydrogenase nickel incorporation protein HypB [Propionivibrio sp.]|uniref:hydrogenase nickel incorporation protein HypB n=1 Tax=Propionivibrio sp. TaxID=2212460 RepID=UPI0025FC5FE9|nr:hydrogenase nickel incorporation protein HypB [Propionivibrio sp.]MBL0207892.1 hydrogenase nickel incorporation protein HypB [Propionivibrio sp.]